MFPTPTKRPKKQAVKLAIQQKQQQGVSGMFPTRPPAAVPAQMAPGGLTVRNQLRGQKGRAR